MAELKPCPFCGGSNIGVYHRKQIFIDREDYAVHCYTCHFGLAWEDSEQKAVEEWNRRADNG